MRCLLLPIALLFSYIGFAQGVKQADLVGTWHFSKLKTNGETMIDITNPKVGQDAMIRVLKQNKPDATEKDALDMHKDLYTVFSKMYCTFNGDGTFEEPSAGAAPGQDLPHLKGTYKLKNNGATLLQKYDGVLMEDTVSITLQHGILIFDKPASQTVTEYKK